MFLFLNAPSNKLSIGTITLGVKISMNCLNFHRKYLNKTRKIRGKVEHFCRKMLQFLQAYLPTVNGLRTVLEKAKKEQKYTFIKLAYR